MRNRISSTIIIIFALSFLPDNCCAIINNTFSNCDSNLISVGQFTNIYNRKTGKKEWWINDHCFVMDTAGKWHFYGITDEKPQGAPASPHANHLAYAVASKLTQSPWQKMPFPLVADESKGEIHLWAPHVIFHDDLYYMYYCAGDHDHSKYKINLATSTDLRNWKRHPANPMLVDGYDARDPFILRLQDKWVMYYTATSEPNGGNHTVEAVTSYDLINWSKKQRVFTDAGIGTWGGNTESPFVVRRGTFYYLFIGPGDSYVTTKVYRSTDPFQWKLNQQVATITAHAAEIVRDTDGKWFISHCGLEREGLWLAPLEWHDGINDSDTSLPAAGEYKEISVDIPKK